VQLDGRGLGGAGGVALTVALATILPGASVLSGPPPAGAPIPFVRGLGVFLTAVVAGAPVVAGSPILA
jgi:hypothetical protein